MPKTPKRGSNKVQSPQKLNVEIEHMTFWRELAQRILPENKDKHHINEVAFILQCISKHFTNEWEFISKICDKNADTQIKVGVQIGIDRRTTPADICVKMGYAQKHSATIKSQIPDPDQDELPGMEAKKESSEENGGASLGDNPNET